MSEPPEDNGREDRSGGLYLGVVAGLLILIMTMLATLWLRERSARIAAQEQLMDCRQRVEQYRMILQLVPDHDQPQSRPADSSTEDAADAGGQ
ncbi:MAG: hypothetical protein ACP5HU_08935 [Phycisphaerae bacterium]